MKTVKPLFGTLTITFAFLAQVYAQSFLTNGLVAYYPFDGNANDVVGMNNGTVNGATLTTDRFGVGASAYTVGQSEYVSCNDASQLAFTPQTSLSVFAWINFSGNLHGYAGIVSKMYNDSNPTSGFQLGIVDNTLQAQIGQPPAVFVQGTNTLNDGLWHAVGLVVQRTNSTAQLYVDGMAAGATTDTNLLKDLSCTNFLFFGVERNLSIFFVGGIDDVRIYNRALSDSEVQQLYAYETQPLNNGLVAYYPFDGNANDAVGTNNGIVNGAQLATDRFGNPAGSYSFSAYPQSIATSGSAGFPSGTNDFSISVWLALSFIPTNDAEIILCNAVRNDLQLNFSPSTPTTSVLDFWTGGSVLHTPAFAWVPQQWYNIQLVRSQNVVTVYRNGIVIGQYQTGNGVSAPPASDYLQFGLGVPPQIHQFYGQLDDIRVYDRALSTNEVQQLYQNEAGPPQLALLKAVKPSFSNLTISTNYQLQVSTDMITWTNQGAPFTATNSSMVYPQYFDVGNWNDLFFRLQVGP